MPVIGDQVGLSLDRIVLATDFSPASKAATTYVMGLAKRYSSNVMVMHVVDLSIATPLEPALVGIPLEEMRSGSEEKMERLLHEMTSKGIRATAHTLEARNPAEVIVRLSEQLKANLIVTGTHARHGLSKAIEGSCAEGIIRHATCPVLTLGPKAKIPLEEGGCFQTIVFSTDLSPTAAKKAAVALSFAQDCEAKIYLCHILKRPGEDIAETLELQLRFESALEKLIPQSSYDWCSPECVVEQGSVAPHILELAKKVQADLIVMGAKRSSSWLVPIANGVVGRVLIDAECPVLTICSD